VVGVAGRHLEHLPVGRGYGFQESERVAVARRNELRGERLARLERPLANPTLRERRSRAGRKGPVDGRAVWVLDRDRYRAVRIYELNFRERSGDFLLTLHVVDAREGMVSLQREGAHNARDKNEISKGSPNHPCASVKL